MNIDQLPDLPDWDEAKHIFNFNDENEEEWKPNPTREKCKALYGQWQLVFFLIKGLLETIAEEDDIDEKSGEEPLINGAAVVVITDALNVANKIMSSESGNFYVVRMENAAVIRGYARR